MDDRFPIGLILGACMFGVLGFAMLFPAKSQRSEDTSRRPSRTHVVVGVGFLAFSVLLLFGAFNLNMLFIFGPILVVVFGTFAAVAKLIDRRSTGKSD